MGSSWDRNDSDTQIRQGGLLDITDAIDLKNREIVVG